ncbi:glycoside hydrolase, family 47 [Thelonectria olida]|uniref:alpha-1,2-Mannosidase n=1 Tax=Thelonectria olida TaxID=1576542 RepID=A0A9P8WCD3_9HYPO|nr:glycoside hydrolase, family 47 [Thelonectria olida]
MRLSSSPAFVLGLAIPALAGHIEKRAFPVPEPVRAAAVKEAFQLSWDAYYKHAFPHDSLRPISNTPVDDRNGWGVTAIDALTTAIIMEEATTVRQILEFVPTIDFSTTKRKDSKISVFESTIRYLGGLVSSYDLLKGPYKHLAPDSESVEALLDQAASLADSLSIAFNTTSGVPDGVVMLNPDPRISGAKENSIAGMGTLVLEWTRLSDLTGDQKYAKLAQKGEEYLIRPRGVKEPFPGLVGWHVSTETGEFTDNQGGWSGGTDSFYEYLIKMYLYDREAFGEYKDRWILAADSTIKYLASHPTSNKNLTYLMQYSGTTTYPRSGHLASFSGGSFILGGILLKEEKYIKFGLDLAESYYHTYHASPSGIGPEGFHWVDSSQATGGNNPLPPAQLADFYESAGFWISWTPYILRPETVESLWYAYRATGDRKYQDLAWEGFQRMDEHCRAGSGYSGIRDVSQKDGGNKDNFMQSFWLAETLKYLYLIFAEESEVQLQVSSKNRFVFNTEAHPVRIRG